MTDMTVNMVAKLLAETDGIILQELAEVLVRINPKAAETLEFSLGAASMDAKMVEKCYG